MPGKKQPKTQFAALLEKYMREAHLNQNELAELTGGEVSRSTLSKALREGREPSLRVARALIGALDQALDRSRRGPFTRRERRDLAEVYLLPTQQADRDEDTHVIGLLLPNVARSPLWGRFAAEIVGQAAREGYMVVLAQHENSFPSYEEKLSSLGAIEQLGGLISVPAYGSGPLTPEYKSALRWITTELWERGIPTVFVDRRLNLGTVKGHEVPFVGPDNRVAVREAIDHLYLDNHHEKIGAIFELPHVSSQQERLAGFQAALESHGLEYREEWVIWQQTRDETEDDEARARSFRRSAQQLLDLLLDLPVDDRPTAVFCATYRLALALAEEVAVRDGVSIPETLSVVGFDDIAELDSANPPLSRVGYPLASLAKAAFDKIIALMADSGNSGALKQDLITDIKVNHKASVESVRDLSRSSRSAGQEVLAPDDAGRG